MKLMIVIIRNADYEPVIQALVEKEFRVTYIASTGGFLRRGNTTLLIGTEEDRIDQALEIIRNACSPAEAGQRRATIFVANLDSFKQL